MALVTGNYVNVADGASLTLHRAVDALVGLGVQIAVVAPGGRPRLAAPATMFEIPSMPMPFQDGYRLPLGLGRDARRRLAEFGPQLVHVASPDLASLMALRFACRRGLPTSSSFHTNFASYLGHWGQWLESLEPLAWKLQELFYARCDQVFVPTESMGEELRRHGVLREWALLERGVDAGQFGPRFRSMD